MTDRYKFRGKDIKTGERVFGDLIKDGNKRWINDSDVSVFTNSGVVWVACQAVEVDPATVGMFTGLKDKNGMDIYEGMWVKHEIMRETYKYSNDGNPFENDIGVTMDDPLGSRFHAFIYGHVAIRKSTGQVIVVDRVELCDDCDSCFYPDEPQEWNPDYYRLRCTEERTEVTDTSELLEGEE